MKQDDFPYVYPSQREDIFKVTEHLITVHGYEKIYCLTGPEGIYEAEERLAGFRMAMEQYDLNSDNYSYGDFWINSPRMLVKDIVDKKIEMPEAIVCTNDSMAISLCDELKSHGIKVPEQIGVTGYDGSFEALSYEPVITTVVHKQKELAFKAFSKLCEIMCIDFSLQTNEKKYNIRYGESCGCFPKKNNFQRKLQYNMIQNKQLQELYLNSNLMAQMSSVKNLQEFKENIIGLKYLIPDLTQLDICLCDNWNSNYLHDKTIENNSSYTSKMMLLLSNSHHYNERDIFLFETRNILPFLSKEHEPQFIVLLPIHYLSWNIGYMAMYYANGTEYKDVCTRAIIFIYAVSDVDLTYLHYYLEKNDNTQYVQNSLIDIVENIFYAFVGKEYITVNELEGTVYKAIYKRYWSMSYKARIVSYDDYMNFNNSTCLYDIGKIQIEEDCDSCKEDDIDSIITRFGDYVDFNENISVDEFESEILRLGMSAWNYIEYTLEYVRSLITAKSIKEFTTKYKEEVNPINGEPIRGKGWKELYLLNKTGLKVLTNEIRNLICGLRVSNDYLKYIFKVNFYIEYFQQAEYRKKNTAENVSFFNSEIYKSIQKQFYSLLIMIQIQVRINKELGTFGCSHYRMNTVRKQDIKDTRELVALLEDYLFYKVNFYDESTINTSIASMKLYTSGKQKTFTEPVKDGIIKHISYQFKNNNCFYEQVWQFYCYAFGIDFYMLRSDAKTKAWTELIIYTLDMIEAGFTVARIEKCIHKKYIELQYENEKICSMRFTPDEIDVFRKYDSIGLKYMQYIMDNMITIDNSPEITALKTEMTNKYIDIKIKALDSKLNSSLIFLESVLLSKSITKHDDGQFNYIPIEDERINWKYRVYTGLHNEQDVYRAINNHELDDFMKYIAVYFSLKRQHLSDNTYDIKGYMLKNIKRLKKLTDPYYSAITSVSGESSEIHDEIFELNKNFLQCDEIRYLHTMLDFMYKYTTYSQWYIEQMRIKKFNEKPKNE